MRSPGIRVATLAAALALLALAGWIPSTAHARAPRVGPRAVEQKKQVPKPEEKKKATDEKKDEDEGSDWDCLGDCLGSLFSGGSKSEPPPVSSQSLAPARPAWSVGSLAMILPGDTLARDTDVWDGPGGAAAGRAHLGRLRIGTDVRIAETHAIAQGLWLRVEPREPGVVSGWVEALDVAARSGEPGAPAERGTGVPPDASAGESWPRPSAATWINVSGFQSGPRDLNLDYKDGGPSFGVQHVWCLDRSFAVGPRIGWGIARGSPRFLYETLTATDSTVDTPSSSTLQIFDVGVRAGQYLLIGERKDAALFYGVGPTVYWVRESAHVSFETRLRSDGSLIASGTRKEALERWRLGGEVVIGAARRFAGRFHFGVTARAFAIPWRSEQRKSLTIDFIGNRTLLGGEVGVTLGHDWF